MSASLIVDASVALVCLSLSAVLYTYHSHSHATPNTNDPTPRAYILANAVTHARLLPVSASHSFTYPSLSLLVSLCALEAGALDLVGGWVFGYGGVWGRLVGLRAAPYLADSPRDKAATIRGKLEALLAERGFVGQSRDDDEARELEDAWMMTMPSFLGFEGINPLTVYFCYRTGSTALWLVVLEIHNTFGETHVHVLEAGVREDAPASRPKGFDHQWTFLREFHVSPFNDRSGFYTVSVKAPTHAPSPSTTNRHAPAPIPAPRPAVRVHLHTASPTSDSPGPLKLTALLRPTRSSPLTTLNLLLALARAPTALLLSLPRILAQAWVLHYKKRLDVFLRPEPLPPVPPNTNKPDPDPDTDPNKDALVLAPTRYGGGVKWLPAGPLDRFARTRVEAFLEHRITSPGTRLCVSLVAADPAVPDIVFRPPQLEGEPEHHLVVRYLAPRFFTLLFTAPSAAHALLLGADTEGLFAVSDRALFLAVFSPLAEHTPSVGSLSPTQRLRTAAIPSSLSLPLHVPAVHPLDALLTSGSPFSSESMALRALFALDAVERWVFGLARARIVKDDEPWSKWEKAAAVLGGRTPGGVEREWGSVVSNSRE
ncbi:hypothetical protein H0H81_009295 [Sphagnurus paluster]|uniref:DUF1365-domain-containing protein n=1 Tax=Sphagnurus paluster TaxID=117069 RepID=A0A9P7KKS4_9AGAR|nr:hypothetical protein H0H81_009295 [Sphagnurus paluster]